MLDFDENIIDAPEHPPACAVLACVQSYSRRGVLAQECKEITVVTLNDPEHLGASKVS